MYLKDDEQADEQDPFAKKDRDDADKLAAIARAFEDKYVSLYNVV